MSTITYTDSEIAEIWQKYNSNLTNLESFDQKTETTKKEIIEKIRDTVIQLVESKKIQIQKTQIANYVYTLLHDRKIQYHKSHFYDIFSADHKGKYKKSAIGDNHTHDFKKNKTDFGIWEKCECGTNKINGTTQQDKLITEEKIPKKIAEIVTPFDDEEIQILNNYITISENNIRTVKLLKSKITINKLSLDRQINSKIGIEQQERIKAVEEKTKRCYELVKTEFKKLGTTKEIIHNTNKIITSQIHTIRTLDTRTTLTIFEKIMSRLAYCIGYDSGDIARTLEITTKHMRTNILKESKNKESLLNDINWFGRCPNPNCGIILKDFFQDRIQQWEKGSAITDSQNYEIELLIATGYQAENIKLKKIIAKK